MCGMCRCLSENDRDLCGMQRRSRRLPNHWTSRTTSNRDSSGVGALETSARPRRARVALDWWTRRWRHVDEQACANDGAGEKACERIVIEEDRRASHCDGAAIANGIDGKSRHADELIAKQGDPPCERVAADLLDFGLVERECSSGVLERTHVCPGVGHRTAVKTA